MTRWFRSHWAEEDIWYYFEVDADGWVIRQVELQGPLQKPIAAASFAEDATARRAGTGAEYEATFGGTATIPVQEWEEHDPKGLTAAEFDAVWATAHAVLEARARTRPAPDA